MAKTIDELKKDVDDKVSAKGNEELLLLPLVEWIPKLSPDCQVYQLDSGGFLAKRFSQINYQLCDEETAEKILVDNLYAMLTHKYFTKVTDEVFDRIGEIINKMTVNLSLVLKTLTFNKYNIGDNDNLKYVRFLPDGCIAFKNGVYDFRKGDWLFKYDKIELDTGSTIIIYPTEYIIKWYFNYNFQPLEISVANTELRDFIEIMKDLDKSQRNYCFELLYNMSHTREHLFDYNRFEHLCQIMGYLCLNSFTQYFVFFVGAGGNGKNSLFDGCFTDRIVPKPSTNDLQSIEDDKFITGSLEGVSHNIYLESSPKTYRDSKNLKNITGSPNQTIERKGVSKYSGIINCKFIFSANDRNETKFSDTSNGFTRRINMIELFYTWDPKKYFLRNGDYYDTTFSADLHEITEDLLCATIFIYFAMYGIKSATKNFTSSFNFTHNEWSTEFSEIDEDLKIKIENINFVELFAWGRKSKVNEDELKNGLYSKNKQALWKAILNPVNNKPLYESFTDFLYQKTTVMDSNDQMTEIYCCDRDIEELDDFYISTALLKKYLCNFDNPRSFTLTLQKIYGSNSFTRMGMNNTVMHCMSIGNKLKVIK